MRQKIGAIFLQAIDIMIAMMLLALAVAGLYLVLILQIKPLNYQHGNKPACECAKEAK